MARVGIVSSSLINFIKAFSRADDDGRVDEGNLNAEERKMLKELRAMDKVSVVETSIRKKYGASVSTATAKKEAKAKAQNTKQKVEKTIDKE